MTLLVSPERMALRGKKVVFLAGSIEMGQAQDWQVQVAAALHMAHPDIVVANPRRAAWDAAWQQSIANPVFREQVDWELDHIERADLVVFYFQPGSQSPITLLELGKHLERTDAPTSTLVCCPEGFWRKGNVEIACDRKGLPPPLADLPTLMDAVIAWGSRQ